MGIFTKRKEQRAQEVEVTQDLLRAMLSPTEVTKEMALQVPAVSGGIDLIAGIIAGTPIKLYREENGKAKEVRDDFRVRLLNDETGDTLNANQFWRAMVQDYYLGKGGYAYIHKRLGKVVSLHYVDESRISITESTDPIFKDYKIQVNGTLYYPHQFLKVLRNTKNGAQGEPITKESAKLIEIAYQTMCFEAYLVKKGGNKKGFLKSQNKLEKDAMDTLKAAFANLYSNTSDNVVVLNKGIEFQESGATSVEMQMNENKMTNAREFSKIFHVSTDIMEGKADEKSTGTLAKLAAIPLMASIQCALNRDLLAEAEKGSLYWAFDTKELLKGSMKERFEAYKIALEANFMQPDEVRFQEDLAPLGLNWVKLGLQDVLFDPKTGIIYTPNTNQTAVMRKTALPNTPAGDTIEEERANPNHDPQNGKFTSGKGGSGAGKIKNRKYNSGAKMGAKEKARISSEIFTNHPNYKPGDQYIKYIGKYRYTFQVNGPGEYFFLQKSRIKNK